MNKYILSTLYFLLLFIFSANAQDNLVSFTNYEGKKETGYLYLYKSDSVKTLNIYTNNVNHEYPRYFIGSDSFGFYEIKIPVTFYADTKDDEILEKKNIKYKKFVRTFAYLVNDCSDKDFKKSFAQQSYNKADLRFLVDNYNYCIEHPEFVKNESNVKIPNKLEYSYNSHGFNITAWSRRVKKIDGIFRESSGFVGLEYNFRRNFKKRKTLNFIYFAPSYSREVSIYSNIVDFDTNFGIAAGYNIGFRIESRSKTMISFGAGTVYDHNTYINSNKEEIKLSSIGLTTNLLFDFVISEHLKVDFGFRFLVFGDTGMRNVANGQLGLLYSFKKNKSQN